MKIKIDISHGKYTVYFISDLHLFHENVIKSDNRPFDTVEQMHEYIISQWNSVVKETDIVFLMGDLCFKNWRFGKEIVHKLNGKIYYILGNHDTINDMKKMERFIDILDYVELSINLGNNNRKHLILMHYPILSWNRKKRGSYMIHGHCHGNIDNTKFTKKNLVKDIGCMTNDYKPYSIHDIIKIMDYKQKNIFQKILFKLGKK